MKPAKCLCLLLVSLFVLCFLRVESQLYAAPMYYTFEGTVTDITQDDAGAIAAAGVSVGDPVSYVMIVDFEADGTETLVNGDTITKMDTTTNDYFFSDYVGGSLIDEVNGGFFDGDTDVAEYNWGQNQDTMIVDYGALHGLSMDNRVSAIGFTTMVSDWHVGFSVPMLTESAFDDDGNQSTIVCESITLTKISAVPIPAAVWLLSSGLLGLVGIRRSKSHCA
ncbi:MAG: VPLPA-CTERM sorting domain-containing protein [Thermodesulfobacteriota bacterium]|nr:VPLPA-CTERM sorting domain-containing protein [Thermodesulfobacteriota bacterium]